MPRCRKPKQTGARSTPGVSVGITSALIPLCLGASGSVRTNARMTSASCAPDVHTFCPLTTNWSPSSTARVDSPARSDPAPGSLMPSDAVMSARRMGTAHRCFCSSVPKDSSDAAMMPTPCGLKRGRCAAGTTPRDERTAAGCRRFGHRIRAGCPAAASHGRTAGAAIVAPIPAHATSSASARRPPPREGRCSSRNATNSARKASTSGSKVSCTLPTYQVLNI